MTLKTTLVAALVAATSFTAAHATVEDNYNVTTHKLSEQNLTWESAIETIPGFGVTQRAKHYAKSLGFTKWIEYAQVAQRMLLNGEDPDRIFLRAQHEVNSYYTPTSGDYGLHSLIIHKAMIPNGYISDDDYDYIAHVYGEHRVRTTWDFGLKGKDPNSLTEGGLSAEYNAFVNM